MSSTYIAELFSSLSDDELVRRAASGELTDTALAIAAAELTVRGIEVPPVQSPQAEAPAEYQGDLTMVARQLTSTEAHLLASCLNAAGIPAVAGDTNFVQTYSLLIGAVGGASVRVPANFVSEAREVIAAYRRGDFALGANFNSDENAPRAVSDEDEQIDPSKWGWGTWLLIDVLAGVAIVLLMASFSR